MPTKVDSLLKEVFAWCEKHSVNQVELAKLLGVKPQHVTEWKKGRNRPSAEAALTMLELLETKPPTTKKR
jgi:DNA-binding transcriptional regulator YiaG